MTLSRLAQYFDLLDIRSTNITAQLAAIDTSMTVFSIIDLVCQHQNTPLTRNCLADGTATELVQVSPHPRTFLRSVLNF